MSPPYLKGMDEIIDFTKIFLDPNKEEGSWEASFKKLLYHFKACLHGNCSEGVERMKRRKSLGYVEQINPPTDQVLATSAKGR